MRREIFIGLILSLAVACSDDDAGGQPNPTEDVSAVQDVAAVEDAQDGSAPDDTGPDVAPPDSEPGPSVLDDIWLGENMTLDGPDIFALGNKPTVDIYLDAHAVSLVEAEWSATMEGLVWIDGRPISGVGVTLTRVDKDFPNIQGKAPMALTFDHVDTEQTFQGYGGLWLHELSRDPSKLREVLGYELYRELGLAAPRAAHAWVRINGEDRGLYVLVEPYGDPSFVSRHDPAPTAPVYGAAGKMDIQGDQVDSFELVHGVDDEREALMALRTGLDAIEDSAPEDIIGALGELIDLDSYLLFAAAEAMLGHKTGYFHGPVRYALYQGSGDGLWRFIPYGLDRSFKGLNALEAKGRIQKICMGNLPCRWAYVDALETVAATIDELKLSEQVDTARPYILAMAEADPFVENLEEVASAINGAESFLANNPGWVLANLDCVDPSFVDKDGDGYNGCGEDCDDENPDQHPGAVEVCDLFDDDCSGIPDDAEGCPQCVAFSSGWGKSYDLCFDRKHYMPARETCVAKGGDLAIVNDPVKQEVLVEAVLGVWWTDWWIGLDDIEEEGVYVWVDGTPLDWSAWADNEPNNSGDEDCNHFASWAGGNWNDMPCDRELAYICEYDD